MWLRGAFPSMRVVRVSATSLFEGCICEASPVEKFGKVYLSF